MNCCDASRATTWYQFDKARETDPSFWLAVDKPPFLLLVEMFPIN